MDKQTYLKHFSRAARWRLGHREAAEVVADYTELLEQRPPEQGDTLVEDLGRPQAAVRLLAEEKSYRRWLWSFWAMLFCLLLPELLLQGPYISRQPKWAEYGPLVLGLALAVFWFRPRGKKTPLPRGILWGLAVQVAMLATMAVVLFSLISGTWERWEWPLESYGPTAARILCTTGAVAAALGILGAVRARMNDRRWIALYVLGLTMVVVCLQILSTMLQLDGGDLDWRGWLMRYSVRWVVLGGVGLVGTGVVLC